MENMMPSSELGREIARERAAHAEAPRFSCDTCALSFMTKDELEKHVKEAHEIKEVA
jgi:hypothetical protein